MYLTQAKMERYKNCLLISCTIITVFLSTLDMLMNWTEVTVSTWNFNTCWMHFIIEILKHFWSIRFHCNRDVCYSLWLVFVTFHYFKNINIWFVIISHIYVWNILLYINVLFKHVTNWIDYNWLVSVHEFVLMFYCCMFHS